MPRAIVVINPASGPRKRDVRSSLALAHDVLSRHGYATDVHVTSAPGDARRMAGHAAESGVDLVVAWGGDGTLNEVGSALAFTPMPMAVVPGGSGNGLARDLGVPLDARAALELAATGKTRRIDAGRVDDALFFNVAGVGLDARIAAWLARPGSPRGLAGYVRATFAELPGYSATPFVIRTDTVTFERKAWFVAFANSRQYGNGAQIAPAARLDDGRLDVVVVEAQPIWHLVPRLVALFRGTLAEGTGLDMAQVHEVDLDSPGPITYHVDGEPRTGGSTIRVRIHPGALWLRHP